jgi:hypothetical protein
MLEAHATQSVNAQAYMTLAEWCTYYDTNVLPDTPAAHQWYEQAQARRQEVAATLAIFDDDFDIE